jgi:ABC-type transport system involved in multi-copper enzyme maturation permease subunit
MGGIFFFSLKVYADFPQEEPLMVQFFKSMWLPLSFVVPILTTKAIVSEKAERLFDSLLLLRIGSFSILLGKFLVIYGTYVVLWTVVAFFPELAQHMAPSLLRCDNFVTAQVRWGGWLFVNLMGGPVIAFGLLVSTYAKTPATAMATSVVGIFLFLISGQIFRHVSVISLNHSETFASLYDNWNVFSQLEDFCHGIFDTRVIVVYLTLTVAMLLLAAVALRKN